MNFSSQRALASLARLFLWSILLIAVFTNVFQKYFEKSAFEANYNLQAVFLPTSLVMLRTQAFADCGLLSVGVPSSVTFIEEVVLDMSFQYYFYLSVNASRLCSFEILTFKQFRYRLR